MIKRGKQGFDLAKFRTSLMCATIDRALEKVERGPFDQSLWPDVYMEVIRPLIRNMRKGD